MSAGSSVPSLRESEAKSTSAQLTVEPLDALHKRQPDNDSQKKQGDDTKAENNSTDGAREKVDLESPVEVDADLEAEDDPEISQIPAEVRRVVSLHDDSMHS